MQIDKPLSSLALFSIPVVRQRIVHQALLFLACLLILLRTMVPTLYTLDSAELATGVATLGIVHAPGYPLYLVVANLFSHIPIGDIAFRVNLFSALCLALTAPLLYGLLYELISDAGAALASALMFMWSYHAWSAGIVAEIYAPQIATIAACGWLLVGIYRRQLTGWKPLLGLGVLVGIAVAMAASSVLVVPGLVISFRAMKIPWRKSFAAGAVSLLVFGLTLLYFPIRFGSNPALNMAGEYDAAGIFHTVNLQSVQGILWMIRGTQFGSLFFAEGYLPSLRQLGWAVSSFWNNYLGFGLIIGLVGAYVLYITHRRLLVVWLAFFVPYTYFFMTYGAPDRDTMLGPSFLLWAVLVAYALAWATHAVAPLPRWLALLAVPLIMLAVNFSRLDASHDTSVRDYSQALLAGLPPNANVLGVWWDIAPMQFLQMVEGQRPDVKLFNTFLFDRQSLNTYIDTQVNRQQGTRPTMVVLGEALRNLDPMRYVPVPLPVNDSLPQRSGDGVSVQPIAGAFYVTRQTGVGR
jgi:hypothetical protein